MVRPEYQRRGLGRLLTEKCNEVADAGGAATYVRAQPGAAGLFIQTGYEVLERFDFDLNDFGAEGGRTAVFVMKREPGAKEQRGRRLD
jgi:ribosomal protein S18 acetylase RimI-like enzyme